MTEAGGPFALIRELCRAGVSMDEGVERVLQEAPRRWPAFRDFFRPAVVAAWKRAAGEIAHSNNRVLRNALMPTPTGKPLSQRQLEAVDRRLSELDYRTADGEVIKWYDMPLLEIRRKIAKLRSHIGGAVDHLVVLLVAEEICEEYGVNRPREVEGVNLAELYRRKVAQRIEEPTFAVARSIVVGDDALVPVPAAGSARDDAKKANSSRTPAPKPAGKPTRTSASRSVKPVAARKAPARIAA